MRLHRFYLSRNRFSGNTATIVGPPMWHIGKVLRLGAGDRIIAFDGRGREYLLRIDAVQKHQILAAVEDSQDFPPDAANLILVQAIPKQKQIDFILQKATELGVASIVPVFSDRSIPHFGRERSDERTARWRQIVMDASAQCGRNSLPEIATPAHLREVLSEGKTWDRSILLDPDGAPPQVGASSGAQTMTALFAGPEGGFAPAERQSILDGGAEPWSVGTRVLRVETAVVVGLAFAQAVYGDLGRNRPERRWDIHGDSPDSDDN